ncbi:MAG TPA: DUF488 domain-containing protein [Tepidisphaeraceae bacterium]|nr:DUF488 domain-containing protein [Tepidisphaeraceae bacterium]
MLDSPTLFPNPKPTATIHTIGHSTRAFDDFIAILHAHGVRAIADVRLIPKSRRYPQFADTFLADELPRAGIAYLPFKGLGGRRRPMKNSPNTGWRNESFRGYADYLQTPAFLQALDRLMESARAVPTATMCAEAVPWRCHRSLISDALIVRGWQVLDIFDAKKVAAHKLTSFAKVEGTTITYPPIAPASPA